MINYILLFFVLNAVLGVPNKHTERNLMKPVSCNYVAKNIDAEYKNAQKSVVSIFSSKTESLICLGVIYSENIVVTNAQCLKNETTKISTSDVFIVNEISEKAKSKLMPASFEFHPERRFVPETSLWENDIAIIKFEKSLLSKNRAQVTIGNTNKEDLPKSSNCFTIGHLINNSDETTSEKIMGINLKILDENECKKTFCWVNKTCLNAFRSDKYICTQAIVTIGKCSEVCLYHDVDDKVETQCFPHTMRYFNMSGEPMFCGKNFLGLYSPNTHIIYLPRVFSMHDSEFPKGARKAGKGRANHSGNLAILTMLVINLWV